MCIVVDGQVDGDGAFAERGEASKGAREEARREAAARTRLCEGASEGRLHARSTHEALLPDAREAPLEHSRLLLQTGARLHLFVVVVAAIRKSITAAL